MRLPAARASAISRLDERSAVSASRTSGWLVQSPGRASGLRSFSRSSSSEWKAARRWMAASTRLHALVVGDQQRAGGGAHEHLDPATAGQPLQLAQLVGVLVRAADVEGVVAVHAVLGAGQLVGQRLGRGRVRIGVRHLEDGGDAAQHRAARAGLQVFLPLHARLAEVHLGVDDAGQDGQAAWRRTPRPPRPGQGRRCRRSGRRARRRRPGRGRHGSPPRRRGRSGRRSSAMRGSGSRSAVFYKRTGAPAKAAPHLCS